MDLYEYKTSHISGIRKEHLGMIRNNKEQMKAGLKGLKKVLALLFAVIMIIYPMEEVNSLAGTISPVQVKYGIYRGYSFADDPTNILDSTDDSAITLVTNGTKAYGETEVYTNISGTYRFLPQENGKVKGVQSKVICVISEDPGKPNVDGKGSTSKGPIASATLKNGVIKVKAGSNPGSVYLHIIDAGTGSLSSQNQGAWGICKINVLSAPSKIQVTQGGDETKIVEINDGKEAVVYVKALYIDESGKEVEVADGQEIVAPDSESLSKIKTNKIDVAVDPKSAPYFSVSSVGSDGKCTITLKELDKGKETKGRITFSSPITGVKTTVQVVGRNPITAITGLDSESAKLTINGFNITYTIPNNAEKTQSSFTSKISLITTNKNTSLKTTDKPKICAGNQPTSITLFDPVTGSPGFVSGKPTKEQSKIKVKLNKDKETISLTIAKGTVATTAYFDVEYNLSQHKIITVEIKSTAPASGNGTGTP